MRVYFVWIIPCIQLVEFVRCDYKRYEVDSNIPFWANRGKRGDDTDPFWANRGRRADKRPAEIMQPNVRNDGHSEWNTLLEEPLFVEEPRWIPVRRDDERKTRNFVAPRFQPYFVTRGKRPQHHHRKRERQLQQHVVNAGKSVSTGIGEKGGTSNKNETDGPGVSKIVKTCGTGGTATSQCGATCEVNAWRQERE